MSIKRWVVLGLLGMLIAFCCAQVYATPDLMQYALPAPVGSEQKGNMQRLLDELSDISLQWVGVVSHTAVTADKENTVLMGDGGRMDTVRLTGEYGSVSALPSRLLRAGRAFYAEELESGAKVMILDEQLAIVLFRVGDPIGRMVMVDDAAYTVVGVARHTRAAGDAAPYGAYVPLKALDTQGVSMDTMTVWGKAVEGAGALTKFHADMKNWQPKGHVYSLGKERTRAVLPVWLLTTACLLLIVLSCFRFFGALVKRLVADYRKRLEMQFAVQLTPYLLGYTAYGVLVLGGVLALSYLWAQVLLWPVPVFPEWIPAVPVEVSDIFATWWQNVQTDCRLIEIRTREVLALRRWHMLIRLLCTAAGAVFLSGNSRMRVKNK